MINFKDKKTLSITASILLAVILTVIVLVKYPFREILSTFTNFKPLIVVLYLVVSALIMIILSYRWKIILQALGHKIPFYKLIGYRIIGYGISYITPSAKMGGEPVMAAMLKRRGLSFKEGLSSVIIDKTLELSVSALFFFVGVLILIIDYAVPERMIIVLVLLAALFLYLVWRFYARILKGKPVFAAIFKFFRLHKLKSLAKYQTTIHNFEKPIINFYKTKRKEFFIASGLSILSLMFSVAEFKLVLLLLGIDASIGISFIVFSVAGLAFLIPLPMALGSFEALQASLFSLLKIGPAAAGIGVAVITRSRDLLWVLGAVVLSIYVGSFKNILSKAYKDRPVLGVKVGKTGDKRTIDIKIHRPR